MGKVLIACEESQAVTKEMRALGVEAWSCDIEPCSGGHPEWHIQGDVTPLLEQDWDMIIAFPPCTYTTNAGARFLYPKGELNNERLKKGMEGKDFFMKFYNARCDRIAIENPTPSKIYGLPECSQVIQPWQFGHPFKKRTQLWLKGLPKLIPTNIVSISESTKIPGNWFNKGGKGRQKNRSKTFHGIAVAMAVQWGASVINKRIVIYIEEENKNDATE